MEESTMTAQRRIEIASTPGSCGTLKTLLASLLALTVILYTDDPAVHVAAVWAVVIFAAAVVRLDMVHPYCWFSMAFALYNTAYTILYLMGDDVSAGCRGLLEALSGAKLIDFLGCERREELYAVLRRAMGWKDWYGENLDALWDVLTGLPHEGARFVIALPREDSPARDYAAKLREVFREADALAE